MSDDLEQFEDALRSLVPRPLSEPARDAIQKRLGRASWWRTIRRMAVIAAAACLLAVIGATLWSKYGAPPKEEPDKTPGTVSSTRDRPAPQSVPTKYRETVYEQVWDEGTVFLDPTMPCRKVRRSSLERVSWRDPERGVNMEVVVPREEIVLIGMETY